MFAYCTEVLQLSEAEAYLRIAAARASRKHPMLLTMLGDGRLHLTAIAKLAPHLTSGNRDALLRRAAHQSKREIEELVAELAPRPDAPALMRKLPERRAQAEPTSAFELGLDGVAPPAPRIQSDAATTRAIELRLDGVDGPGVRPERATKPDGGFGGDGGAPPMVPAAARSALVEPLAPSRYKADAASWTSRADAARRATGSSFTTGIPSGMAVTAAWRIPG
jgi:hypothetical protein